MSRRCELTGVGPMTGHHVSHSNIKSKRRFLPALAPASLQSDALGQTFRLRITNAARRTLDFRGGLDVFLLKAKDEALSARALKIKRQLKAKLAETPAPTSIPLPRREATGGEVRRGGARSQAPPRQKEPLS
jgi:large subunit ribosomal protein L28